MADYLEIARLNSLNWVRTDNQSGTKPNFDNRLLHQENHPNYYDFPYYQKFNIGDTILTQIATSRPLPTVKLINALTLAQTTLTFGNPASIIATTSYGLVYFYNLSVDTTSLKGKYYITMTFGTIVYQCDYFEVGDYSTYPLFQYTHSEIGQFKGIWFSGVETFGFRLDSRMCEVQYGLNKVTHESFNSRLENLSTDIKRYAILELDAIPRYILEKINVATQLDTLIVNGVNYQIEDSPEQEFVKDGIIATNRYTGIIKLREVEFEIYEELEALIYTETNYIMINDTDKMSINDTDKLLNKQ